MANNKGKIKNKEAFVRVREILAKNNSILGKTTLTVFIVLGLLALASPAALPGGIAALGIGAGGIFLDQVTQKSLSEKEIIEGVQKIINGNGVLQQKEFCSYMAPYYTKLLQISDDLESFATEEDMIKAIEPLLPKIDEILEKMETLVTTEYLDHALDRLNNVNTDQREKDKLKEALSKLEKLPTDEIPEPSSLPTGSHFPNIRPNPLFLGREEELKIIAGCLKGNNQTEIGQVVTINGFAGVGKTQLAAEFAHRYGRFFMGGVFWINCANSDLIASEIASCRDLNDNLSIENKVKKIQKEWNSPIPRLLIFDNCEEIKILMKWLPSSGGSRVIATGRYVRWSPDLGIHHLKLKTFSRVKSKRLLYNYVECLTPEDPIFDAIAAELGDLPLALHMAGNYLQTNKYDISPMEYLKILKKKGSLFHDSLSKGNFSPTGHELNVGRTFSISMDHLKKAKASEKTLKLLICISCFAPGVWIPRELLAKCCKTKKRNSLSDILTELIKFGFIEENEKGNIWIHKLISDFTKLQFSYPEILDDVERGLLDTVWDINESGLVNEMAPLVEHLSHITDNAFFYNSRNSALLGNEY